MLVSGWEKITNQGCLKDLARVLGPSVTKCGGVEAFLFNWN